MGIISYVNEEIQVIRERDPAIKSNMEVFLYSSFKAILHYRIAHKLYLKKHYFLARWVSQRAARKTGIEIHPGATIGKGLFIDHGSGVIIGETAELGDNITLYQGVTLGGTVCTCKCMYGCTVIVSILNICIFVIPWHRESDITKLQIILTGILQCDRPKE